MLTPITPPNPIEANVDYRYDGCYQSMALVLLQRIVDASGGGGANPQLQEIIDELTELNGKVATEATLEASRALLASLDGKDFATQATLALVEAITSQMTFTGGDLNVNASVSLPAGLATEAKQDAQIVLETAANALLTSLDGKDYATQATLEAVRLLVASLDSKDYATEATLATRLSKADFETRINTLGQKTSALSTPVVLSSDQPAIAVNPTPVLVTTTTSTPVTVSTTVATIAALNTARKGLFIYNDSGRDVFVRLAAGATDSVFTLKMEKDDYYEMPQPIYTGVITAITDAGSGDILVTQL